MEPRLDHYGGLDKPRQKLDASRDALFVAMEKFKYGARQSPTPSLDGLLDTMRRFNECMKLYPDMNTTWINERMIHLEILIQYYSCVGDKISLNDKIEEYIGTSWPTTASFAKSCISSLRCDGFADEAKKLTPALKSRCRTWDWSLYYFDDWEATATEPRRSRETGRVQTKEFGAS
ncbi:uncharacterized protein PG998_014781 [Apiospora kogelbergensis]|uniref:uncharacterized protein n=1 Tax=Apiospora kogelbergensis TaxID=1337665 RepID=UPI00312DD0FE